MGWLRVTDAMLVSGAGGEGVGAGDGAGVLDAVPWLALSAAGCE